MIIKDNQQIVLLVIEGNAAPIEVRVFYDAIRNSYSSGYIFSQ